ncbi:MAG TPA: HEAT repeat domain-containing protein [Verrucomicrobiae bacterium]|nr:HEAT repeat domain-containing protein [Verrucomicrobiae bacterium]
MFKALKLWKLAGDLKRQGNAPEAFAAVVQLGALGGEKAVDLLLSAIPRSDGVARSAARELGRLGDPRALKPLAAALANPHINQSCAEALLGFGAKAVDVLLFALKSENADARRLAAGALGEIRDPRAVEPLVHALQVDDEYAVRTAAATALGLLKDVRAVWGLVGTLKLRDETTPERQVELEKLRHATSLALHKVGDPFAAKAHATAPDTVTAALAQAEQKLKEGEVHPKLIGDLSLVTDGELIGVLRELISASEEISWANLESREPMLAGWFKTYDQRAGIARIVGEELHRRGGTPLMRQVFERDLNGYGAIGNWWSGIGGWA